MWMKAEPPWKDDPIKITSDNGLVEYPDGKIRFIGWIAQILADDQADNLPPRDVDFWLGADLSHPDGKPRAIARGMVRMEDQPVVFQMDWDINSFRCLQKLIKDRSLLNEATSHIGEINYYFAGEPKTTPAAPGNSL
jgi:hypothetical protein